MVTSSGMRSSSMRARTKSWSVREAAGKPTSISLYPIATSISNIRSLRSEFMGSISAWLPSRRSTAHQRGARVIRREGQRRSGSSTSICCSKGGYLWVGMPEGCWGASPWGPRTGARGWATAELDGCRWGGGALGADDRLRRVADGGDRRGRVGGGLVGGLVGGAHELVLSLWGRDAGGR